MHGGGLQPACHAGQLHRRVADDDVGGTDHLVLSFARDGMTAFAEALAARPPREEPLTAARDAFHVSLRQLGSGTAGELPSYL